MNANEAALFDAIKANNLSQVQALLKKKVNPNVVDENDWTPLQLAAFSGHEPAITALLAAGADVNQAKTNGATPLYIAAEKGHASAISAMCEAGADVNQAKTDGATPLFIAAQFGHVPALTALLAAGADVNLAAEDGVTPLYIAAQNGHAAAITALCEAGADVNLANKNGFTPLFIAAYNGHEPALTALLAAGADVNLAAEDGVTPLYIAAQNGHASALTALLAAGADVNQAKANGATPLHIAAQFGHAPAVTALCEAGADVNQARDYGFTPLYIAAQEGHAPAITALLAAPQINLTLKTRPGHEAWANETALDIAKRKGQSSIVKLIEAKAQALASVPSKPVSALPMVTEKIATLSFSLTWIAATDMTYGQELGRGGFGVVYQGSWQGSQVAIKEMYGVSITPAAKAEMEHELGVMAHLHHPNVIQLFGACKANRQGGYSLVMELMPEGSLYQAIHNGQAMSWDQRYVIAQDVLSGLWHLHSKEIVHCDLKSLNVLLGPNGRAKLTDFGLSTVKAETKSQSTTMQGEDKQSVGGTVAWMAPELFKRRAKPTKASDMYSYAMVLWEMASRKVPFADAQNPVVAMGWIEKGIQEDIPSDCDAGFKSLIGECWKKEASARPTAAALSARLSTLFSGRAGGATGSSERAGASQSTVQPLQSGPGFQGGLATGRGFKR